MIRVGTPSQMNGVDERAAREYGIPTAALMERAGEAVFRSAGQMLSPGGRVLVLCGSGNNGGDGLAAARLLHRAGFSVVTVLAAEPSPGSLAAEQFRRLQQAGGQVIPSSAVAGEGYELVIDALLGTGLSRDVSGAYQRLIEWMNGQSAPVLAVDIPSGVDGLTGRVRGVAVRARQTVVLAGLKPGNLLYPGRALTGSVRVEDIGVPPALMDDLPGCVWQREDVTRSLPPRPADSHKGHYGHAVIVAGSRGMMGAGGLAAWAAMAAGAGLTTWAHPAVPLPAVPLDLMTRCCPAYRGHFAARSARGLLAFLGGKSALALGPGLGRSASVQRLVTALLDGAACPTVLDADGLNAWAQAGCRRKGTDPLVLTPHPGEMARLRGLPVEGVLEDPVGTALSAARALGAVVLLKGATSVVADPDGRIAYNTTGNPGMAKGGSGDVLTGIIAGFLAQGMAPWEAACAGAWIHGRAGDIAASRLSRRAMTPTDIIAALSAVFLELEGVVP